MSPIESIRESLRAIGARLDQIEALRTEANSLREQSWELYQKLQTFNDDLRDLHLLCEGAALALDSLKAWRKGADNV